MEYLSKSLIDKFEKSLVRRCCLVFVVLFSLSVGPLFAQSTTVTGIVYDDMGMPFPGVNVVEKGTTTGTITNIDGAYSIRVSDGSKSVLEFSCIGYLRQDIKVDKKTYIKVTLQEDSQEIDEVVVVGYAVKRKGSVAASVSTIKGSDVARSTSSAASGALVGKVAGITTRQKSGLPGSGTSLQIRNMGTPLYVIDGIMKDEDAFNNININDIDNISILKDGAAAIYGVKAANGVVLVTTKTGGKNQKPQVNVNAYMGWQQWTEYPDLLNAHDWVYANYMSQVNRGLFDKRKTEAARAELEKWKSGSYDPATGEDYRGYDWKDAYVSNAAPQQSINASISGGTEKSNYYISVAHLNQDAVFKDYNFNRTNVQANYDIQLTDNFKIGYQMSGRIQNRSNPALPGADDSETFRTALFYMLPTTRPFANDNPQYIKFQDAVDGNLNLAAYDKEHSGEFRETWRVIQNNFNLEYKTPLKGLVAKGTFSYYYGNNTTSTFEKGWQAYSYNRAEDSYDLKYDKTAAGSTYLGKLNRDVEDLTGQFLLSYNNTFAKKHNVSAVGGFEFYRQTKTYRDINQSPVENIFLDLLSTNEFNSVEEHRRTISTASMIMRAGYDYMGKYIVDFAGRYDGSWKFPSNSRWGFFPSVSAAWRVSEENFFKESSISEWFSNLKIRASYGEMGDDNLNNVYNDDPRANQAGVYPDFAYMEGYAYKKGSSYIPMDPTNGTTDKMMYGAQYKGVPITTLSWMKTSITNVGIDLGFFNNKLTAEFDLFKRIRSGIPGMDQDVVLPLECGFDALPRNLNSDETMGMDWFIKWNDAIGDVKYSVGLNATLARQRNGRRARELFYNAWDKYRYAKDKRWANVDQSAIWMYETIGVFQTQEEIDNYPVIIDGKNNESLLPGDLIFKDVNGDGVIDQFDERPKGYVAADWPWDSSQGNKNPLLSMGLNLGFEWKGIDIAADFAGGFMNTFVADWNVKWGAAPNRNGYAYNSTDVWRHEDIFDPSSAWIPGKFPALRYDANPSTRWWNDFYTKEASYVRLRNLVVGYTIPPKWTQKALIQKLRVYFEGTNLFCWDTMGDYGFDPEVSSVNGFDYPQHRVYTVGLSLTF